MSEPTPTVENLEAHRAYLQREVNLLLCKKPAHVDYAKLNTLGQALGAIHKMLGTNE